MVGKSILYGTGIVILALIGAIAWQVYQKSDDGGLEANDFTLPRMDQEGILSLSDYRGKVVVLNFWASWCVPCQEEAPDLQTVWQEYQDQDVQFIGINSYQESKEADQDALAFMEEFAISYPNVLDADNDIAKSYNIYALPVTVILDKDGYIRKVFFQSPSRAELRAAIDKERESS